MQIVTSHDDTPLYGDPDLPLAVSVSGGLTRVGYPFGAATGEAVFTPGAKTVTLTGQRRTFTEQKKIFTDDFGRAVTTGWGQSPGGGLWGTFQGSDSNYSVSSGGGRIASASANVSRYARINDTLKSVDFQTQVTLDTLPTGASTSAGVVFAWSGVSNHYRCRITFNTTGSLSTTLAKNVAGSETVLAGATTVGTGWVAGEVWNIRVVHDGVSSIATYVWKEGTAQPGTPTHTATDSTFTQGDIGVRVITTTGGNTTGTAIYDNFKVNAATWPTPPTVTHNTWVRALPYPFVGWTADVAAWLRNAAEDTTPDALAYAVSYINGGPVITDPRRSNKQVLGVSGYGPLNPDGTRIEGADFNDYIGITWIYLASEGGTTDTAEASQLHCLDCSGLVRMVFGYWLGLPMTQAVAAYFDGLNIPRNTQYMGPSGPGVVIASMPASAPATTDLRIGDVLFFDADQSDEAEGQIDHCGIYLGVDDNSGLKRFISSRKTVNGPTFGDCGGPSVIGSSGTYSTRFRKIRRF